MIKVKKNKRSKVKRVVRKKNKVHPAFNLTELILYMILAIVSFWIFLIAADYLNIPRVISYSIIGILVVHELMKTKNR
tara:strand:- start:575 stop:808 length:234 start_codon:yes stop_codon:yes gene_type:complete